MLHLSISVFKNLQKRSLRNTASVTCTCTIFHFTHCAPQIETVFVSVPPQHYLSFPCFLFLIVFTSAANFQQTPLFLKQWLSCELPESVRNRHVGEGYTCCGRRRLKWCCMVESAKIPTRRSVSKDKATWECSSCASLSAFPLSDMVSRHIDENFIGPPVFFIPAVNIFQKLLVYS